MRLRFAFALSAAIVLAAPLAWADKVAVLPFSPHAQDVRGLPKAELEEVRGWARKAVAARRDVLPSDAEMLSAERAVRDGSPDTSDEYRAAGRASGSDWTLTGRVERIDVAAQKAPDGTGGTDEGGYTVYRVELEACQVATGRVESLTRDLDPDEAEAQIGEMLALLLRPEGIGTAEIPWKIGAPRRPKPKAKPAPPPPSPPPPPAPAPAPAPEAPVVKHAYAENHPIAIGVSVGVTEALVKPDQARGPSVGVPIGAAVGYAIDAAPGLELRGVFTSQVVGPKAIAIAAGGRYAIPVLAQHRFFVGPEVLLGAHVATGVDKTARFLGQGSLFASIGVGEQVQLEIAADVGAALGGSGTLVLGGGTARALVRF